jgi:hypothetical protein
MGLRPDEVVVRTGTWLYANQIPSDVRIVRTNERPGSGDYEDEPEFRDDRPGIWYRVDFAEAGAQKSFSDFGAGGGHFPDLESAMRGAFSLTNGTLRWDDA